MIERVGDVWVAAERDGAWVVVTTNGAVRRDGCAVMGRGVAREAASRYPNLPRLLGQRLLFEGNHVYAFASCRVFTFPVKAHWRDRADLGLIKRSARELIEMVLEPIPGDSAPVYSVRPGCGNGGLRWVDVRPLIEPWFRDYVAVWEREK